MKTRRILLVGSARPNFMKLAAIHNALKKLENVDVTVVHTGQHYDPLMSDVFLEELDIHPDVYLGIHGGTPISQVARVIEALDRHLEEHRYDLLIVVGDVNAVQAASVAAVSRGIPVAHVEAGMRSFDMSMPEERNRIVCDRLASLHFTTEESANENLRNEGVHESKVHFVGNVMIDTLQNQRDRFTNTARESLQLKPEGYVVATFHRPPNVDSEARLRALVDMLREVARDIPVVFPVHVRTRERLKTFSLDTSIAEMRNIHIIDPLGYNDFLGLVLHSAGVITDSGGIQEETTFLGKPCITVRTTTERPVTITMGTNVLVPDIADAPKALREILQHPKKGRVPPLWDGKAAERIAAVVQEFLAAERGTDAGRH